MPLFVELLSKGGPITWLIFASGVLSVFIILERLFHYHRAQIHVPEFMRGIINVLKRNNTVEAISICDETPGPIAQLLRTIILYRDQGEGTMRQVAQDTGMTEAARLEKALILLSTIAYLAPLLGLLGTVVGMITLFQDMQRAGTFVDTKTLASGIWQALLSTAAGLSVALPAYGFYNYFVGRIDYFIIEMEKASSEMIHFLLGYKTTKDGDQAS